MASIARVQLEEPHTVMVACSAGLVSLIELISIPFISSLHSAKGKSFFLSEIVPSILLSIFQYLGLTIAS